MSNPSIGSLRKYGFAGKIKNIIREIIKARTERVNDTIETDDIRSFGRMSHSTVLYDDEKLSFIDLIDTTVITFELPAEPDGVAVKVMLFFDHLGNKIIDLSGFKNDGTVEGDPLICRTSVDLGFMSGSPSSPAVALNLFKNTLGTINSDAIVLTDNSSVRFKDSIYGYSIFLRFNTIDFSKEGGLIYRQLVTKRDDSNHAFLIDFDQDGYIHFQLFDSPTTYRVKSLTPVLPNQWYDLVATYNPVDPGAELKLWLNGSRVDVSSTDTTHSFNDVGFNNLYIGTKIPKAGYYKGYIQDFRIYGKELLQDEITNLWTNKVTVASIPFGKTAIFPYFCLND